MNIAKATRERIADLCYEKRLNYCHLSSLSGVPYTTIKSVVYNQSKNPGIVTLKKICDGFDISISEFFDTEIFRTLEQEIK